MNNFKWKILDADEGIGYRPQTVGIDSKSWYLIQKFGDYNFRLIDGIEPFYFSSIFVYEECGIFICASNIINPTDLFRHKIWIVKQPEHSSMPMDQTLRYINQVLAPRVEACRKSFDNAYSINLII